MSNSIKKTTLTFLILFSLGLPVFSGELVRENITEPYFEPLTEDKTESGYFEWICEYNTWYNALTYMAESCKAAVTPGTGICPDEPFFNWARRNGKKLIALLMSYGLDNDELQNRLKQIDTNCDADLINFRENKEGLDEFQAIVIPVLAAIGASAYLTVSSGHYLVRDSAIYQKLTQLVSQASSIVSQVATVTAGTAVTAMAQCFSCGSRCSGCPDSMQLSLTKEITEPDIQRYSTESIISDMPTLTIFYSIARHLTSLPYAAWLQTINKGVLPASLAVLYMGAQLNAGKLSADTLEVVGMSSAIMALAWWSNLVKPADTVEELAHMVKGVSNIMFMESTSPLALGAAISLGVTGGLAMSDCQNTLNAMVLPSLAAIPAVYFQYAKPGEKVPYTGLYPKYLVGAAMITANALTAYTDNHPEYLFAPLMAYGIARRARDNDNGLALVTGTLLLLISFDYFFKDYIISFMETEDGAELTIGEPPQVPEKKEL